MSQSIKLYYAVRDGIRYDPYHVDLTVSGLRASATLLHQSGWCVSKAVLLAACCRAMAIPARLGFADVRNHLSTQQLKQRMGTDVFYWHGYTELWLNEQWVKATPTFGSKLCQRLRLLPLEFDGQHDSLYHAYDAAGQQSMAYIQQRGVYADLPLEAIRQTFKERYNFSDQEESTIGSFDQEIAIERQV